jgi:hypothetical protein
MLMRQIVTVPVHTAITLLDRLKPMEGPLPTERLDAVTVGGANARSLYAHAISRTAGIYYESSGYHGVYERMPKFAEATNAWQSLLTSFRENDPSGGEPFKWRAFFWRASTNS